MTLLCVGYASAICGLCLCYVWVMPLPCHAMPEDGELVVQDFEATEAIMTAP